MLGVYGDGADGALNILTDTNWSTSPPSGSLQFTSISVAAGATLTIPSGIVLRATGNVTINGIIQVLPNPIALAAGSQLQASQLLHPGPTVGGSGNVAGGFAGTLDGGGSFAIYAEGNITVASTGSISANGQNAPTETPPPGFTSAGSGGGGGGVLVLLAKGTLTVAGTVQANGGNGANGVDNGTPLFGGSSDGGGGGGGGGIVHLLASAFVGTPQVQVQGGTSGKSGTSASSNHEGGNGGSGGGPGGLGATAGPSGTPAQNGSAGLVFQTADPAPEDLLS
jgi:hypothetical protein